MAAYRIIFPITALLREDSGEHLGMLGRGVILIPVSPVDRAGLIEATCDGRQVRVFERDLLDRSERLEAYDASPDATFDMIPCS
jgi:hypothetical protein